MSDTKTPAPDVARKLLDIVTGIPIIERGGSQDYQRGFLDGQRFTRDVCADRMRAALAPGGEREGDYVLVPKGWKLVPEEPTQMQLLTLGLLSGAGPQTRAKYIEVYRALLGEPADLPAPPLAPQEAGR